MANPTTNYSFAMPTNTDLVKDLPADFEVFGQAVDTQMKTNADAAIAKSLVTTTGDIIYASGANTPARLGIGSSGQSLVVSGGLPVWSTPASGSMTLLSTTTIATQTSVTISSISQSYKDLKIIIRNYKPAVDGTNLRFRFNADATANRHNYFNSATSGVDGSVTKTVGDSGIDLVVNSDNTVVTASFLQIEIPDYTNTATWKTCRVFGFWNDPTTTTSIRVLNETGIYNQTTAISSFQFYHPDATNMTSGTILIYGVN